VKKKSMGTGTRIEARRNPVKVRNPVAKKTTQAKHKAKGRGKSSPSGKKEKGGLTFKGGKNLCPKGAVGGGRASPHLWKRSERVKTRCQGGNDRAHGDN